MFPRNIRCNPPPKIYSAEQPDVGPVQERNPLGLRLLRRFRLARTVEGNRLANERLEGDVDRAAYVSVEARVEETDRILQRRALGEGKLHDSLVGFASADRFRHATKSECPSTSAPRRHPGLLP
jgi:hypothetical protein